MVSASKWSVDQLVNVKPRTWAGINRPGGVGKITKLHYSNGFVESLDVKYCVGSGMDAKLDLDFVEAYEPLETKGRSRRGRDLYTASPAKRGVPSDEEADARPAKKAKKQSNDKVKKKKVAPKATAKEDENTDPKTTKPVRRKVKANKTAQKAGASTKKDKEKEKKPPATHVIVKKTCTVSPLANTPRELRNEKKKPSKSKSSTSNKASSSKPSAKRAIVAKSSSKASSGKQGFALTKVSLPKDAIKKGGAARVSLEGEKMPPRKSHSKKKTQVQMNRVPLKHVYDTELDRANEFVEDLVGKPKATSLTENEKNPSAECTVTLSPPDNAERINLFVSKLSECVGDDDEGIDKAGLLEKVNKTIATKGSSAHFDRQEMEDCLSALESDGKIMVSDGVIYTF